MPLYSVDRTPRLATSDDTFSLQNVFYESTLRGRGRELADGLQRD